MVSVLSGFTGSALDNEQTRRLLIDLLPENGVRSHRLDEHADVVAEHLAESLTTVNLL